MSSFFLEEAKKPMATYALCRKNHTLIYMKLNQEFQKRRIQTRKNGISLELPR